MMVSLKAPSPELLAQIYRSAVDESEGPAMLRQMAAELNTHSSALLVLNRQDPGASFLSQNHSGPERAALYSEYADKDVLLQASEPHMQAGKVVSHNRYLPDRELMRSDYYQGFCRRFDVHHGMTGLIHGDDRRLVMLCASRQRSAPFGREEVRWLEALVPHVRNAVDVALQVRQLRFDSAAAWAVLDRQPFGVQICDEVGRPVFRNTTLDEIVGRSEFLRFRGGRLDASLADLSRWLSRPLDVVRALRQGSVPMSTTARHGGERYHFVLAPFEVSLGYFSRTFFALFVNDPDAVAASVGKQLRLLYRVTDREAAVALCLARGCSAREAADQLHVAESTIVTHRKHLYMKLGVSRQTQLVRLLGAMQT